MPTLFNKLFSSASQEPPPQLADMMQQEYMQEPQQMMQQASPEFGNTWAMPKFQRRPRSPNGGAIRKMHSDADVKPNATLVSLVVTINESGSSYDELFTRVPQKVGEGERAATYAAVGVSPEALRQLVEMREAAPICQTQPDAAALAADLAAVEPCSVVFNWECCDGCEGDKFRTCTGTSPVPLVAYLLSQGFMVMVSDFSLGALIQSWDASLLGPNPFVKVGEFDTKLTLRFDPTALAGCDDSAQLQVLGELCATGEATVHALGGTKAYVVDPAVRPNDVTVLTIATELGERPAASFVSGKPHLLTHIGQHAGLAGHAIVRFDGGGRLLTACPHWVELSRLDADEAQVLAVAEERYGTTYSAQLRAEFEACGADVDKRKAASNMRACEFVQQSNAAKWVPSSRAKSKASY